MADGWLRAVRPDPGWLPRASVGLGVGATIAMNVAAGSRGGLGGALLGTLPPVGLVLSLETAIWLVRRLASQPRGWAWCAGAGIPLAGLAGITGVISYLHALTVAQWTGDPAEAGLVLTEHLIPLVADLMIVTGSVALVALAVAAKPLAGAGRGDSGTRACVQPPREDPAPRQLTSQPEPVAAAAPASAAAVRKTRGPRAAAGVRVAQPADVPQPKDPALEILQAALAAGVKDRTLAAEHGISRWRATQLLMPGSYANPQPVNGYAFKGD